jgi:hypothetical protein
MVNHVDPLKVQPPPTPRRVLAVKMLEPLGEVGVEPHRFGPHPQGPSGLVGVVQPLVKIPGKDHPHVALIYLGPGDPVGKQKVPDPADSIELPIPLGLFFPIHQGRGPGLKVPGSELGLKPVPLFLSPFAGDVGRYP